jgi:pimeloyl-ACP methyl ester carboxylesterase
MAGRLDAVLAVLQPGDVLVGHSGGGLEITLVADAAPELISHLVYLAAALPLECRLMQESLVYRDDGETAADYDVIGMLQHLRFGDDGSMALPTSRERGRSSTMTATK